MPAVVQGHQAHDAVPGNSDAITAFGTQVARHRQQGRSGARSRRDRVSWARQRPPPARDGFQFGVRSISLGHGRATRDPDFGCAAGAGG